MVCTCEEHEHVSALDAPEVTRCILDGCHCATGEGAVELAPVTWTTGGTAEAEAETDAPDADAAEDGDSPDAAPV